MTPPDNRTSADLLVQEREGFVARFTAEDAWALGTLMRQAAVAARLPVAIEVTIAREPVFFTRLAMASEDNRHWAERKRRVVERFHHSSLYMRLLTQEEGYEFHHRYGLSPDLFAAFGGSVPIFQTDGNLIGTATISGLPDVDDHDFVVKHLRLLSPPTSERP
ncbi:hypothetical protein ASG39_22055 [Rhizobium sp. Leaf371]|uniref:heme-degrading domain-containing protein n=1 Tax=unclassified Rhizobium TaxID=2613769 RepID=UPI0007155768|nr:MULTISPECIES: heme-binding protein [unclassified Rhizobium]KQS69871.1 hypothetical protein ASG39_22055 [Rhizobium sp. Leaf371]TCM45539.1 uncharacterized protein (UPF0303 family) [Rhizobium sp. PP-F2F-G48]